MKKWIAIGGIIIVALAIGAYVVPKVKDTSNKELKVEVASQSQTLPFDQDVKEKQVCAQMYVRYNMNSDSKYGTARNNTLCTDPSLQPSCYLFEKMTKAVLAIKDSTENKITLYDENNREEIIAVTNRLCSSS